MTSLFSRFLGYHNLLRTRFLYSACGCFILCHYPKNTKPHAHIWQDTPQAKAQVNLANPNSFHCRFMTFSFRMFLLLCIILTILWLFFLLSFSKFDGLVYSYITVNAFEGPLILYVCVFNQKHVSFLLRKTCCYASCACKCCRPEPEYEWGDEMTAMNTGI